MSNNSVIVKPEDLQKFIALKPWIRKELGVYKEVCEAFARKVSQLEGVVAIGALPYSGYVDLWTVVKKRKRDLNLAIIDRLIEVGNEYEDLFLDFVIIDDAKLLPEEAIILYQKDKKSVQSIST